MRDFSCDFHGTSNYPVIQIIHTCNMIKQEVYLLWLPTQSSRVCILPSSRQLHPDFFRTFDVFSRNFVVGKSHTYNSLCQEFNFLAHPQFGRNNVQSINQELIAGGSRLII